MIRLVNVYEDFEGSGTAIRNETLKFLYDLLAERPAIANISHRKMPTFEEHVAFVSRRPYQHWYIVEAEPQGAHQGLAEPIPFQWVPVGMIYATKLNEIGIFILQAHQRRGYASQAITQLKLQHEPLPGIAAQRVGYWLANIAPENEASHALFKGLGARPIQITYEF